MMEGGPTSMSHETSKGDEHPKEINVRRQRMSEGDKCLVRVLTRLYLRLQLRL